LLRAAHTDRAGRRECEGGGGGECRAHRPPQPESDRLRHDRGVREAHGPSGRRPRGPGVPGAGFRDRRADHGALLLPPRGAGSAGRRVPHPVPAVEARRALPARPRSHPRRSRFLARVLSAARPRHRKDTMSDVFLLPDPGEGLTEADIVSWKVAAGDTVTVNQVLVEIETAKSLVELPSPHAGTISELLVEEGQTVEVGTPIVRFGPVGGEAPAPSAAETDAAETGAAEAGADGEAPIAEAEDDASSEASSGATLVGYGSVASSSKRRPRKGAPTGAGAAPAAAAPGGDAGAAEAGSRPLAKPPVRKLAKDSGVDLRDVAATGLHG